MKNIRMIATDLDGTLLDNNRKITPNAKKYLFSLKKKGYIIALASGRVISMAKEATDGGEFADYIIFSHGSGVYDMKNKSFLYKNIIDEETAKKIASVSDKDIKYIQFSTPYYHNRLYINSEDIIKEHLVKIYNDTKEFISACRDVTYMTIVLNDRSKSEEFAEKLRNKFKGLDIVCLYDSFDEENKWIEILNTNTSKFNGIEKIAQKEGIDTEEIIAFGDADNDLDMIKKSGIGVAVGNAIDKVKANADFTAPCHYEDGVVKFLSDYLKL